MLTPRELRRLWGSVMPTHTRRVRERASRIRTTQGQGWQGDVGPASPVPSTSAALGFLLFLPRRWAYSLSCPSRSHRPPSRGAEPPHLCGHSLPPHEGATGFARARSVSHRGQTNTGTALRTAAALRFHPSAFILHPSFSYSPQRRTTQTSCRTCGGRSRWFGGRRRGRGPLSRARGL